MKERIESIIRDLYALDPTLRASDRQVRLAVQKILELEPEVNISPKFRQGLRAMLTARIAKPQTQKSSQMLLSKFMNMPLLKFGLTAAVVAAIAVASTLYFTGNSTLGPASNLFQLTPEVKKVSNKAFGTLISATTASAQTGGRGGGLTSDAGAEMSVRPQSGGGGAPDAMIFPVIFYRYVYRGEEITLDQETVNVLRRVKALGASDQVQHILRQFNAGVVDLNSFSGSALQNFTLAQNQPYGYYVSVDLENGQININQNWIEWPDLGILCGGSECPAGSESLDVADIPEDSAMVEVADNFLSDHGISLSGYGQPFVQQEWRVLYNSLPASERLSAYIPDTFTVVYPLMIEGQQVLDENGNPTGLMVSVNVRYDRVVGVWQLTNQQYEASAYDAVTDVSRVLEIAESGGMYGWDAAEGGVEGGVIEKREVKEIELGTPIMGLTRVWHSPDNKISSELFVPSLIFPVTSQEEGDSFYRANVVVPLVKEILESTNPGPIRILEDTPVPSTVSPE